MKLFGLVIMKASTLKSERTLSKVQADDLRTVISELRGSLDESREQLATAQRDYIERTKAAHERECSLKDEMARLAEKARGLEARIRDLTRPVTAEDCIRAVEAAARRKQEMQDEEVARVKEIAKRARAARRLKEEQQQKNRQ